MPDGNVVKSRARCERGIARSISLTSDMVREVIRDDDSTRTLENLDDEDL
jgi:hypothetical protein